MRFLITSILQQVISCRQWSFINVQPNLPALRPGGGKRQRRSLESWGWAPDVRSEWGKNYELIQGDTFLFMNHLPSPALNTKKRRQMTSLSQSTGNSAMLLDVWGGVCCDKGTTCNVWTCVLLCTSYGICSNTQYLSRLLIQRGWKVFASVDARMGYNVPLACI